MRNESSIQTKAYDVQKWLFPLEVYSQTHQPNKRKIILGDTFELGLLFCAVSVSQCGSASGTRAPSGGRLKSH